MGKARQWCWHAVQVGRGLNGRHGLTLARRLGTSRWTDTCSLHADYVLPREQEILNTWEGGRTALHRHVMGAAIAARPADTIEAGRQAHSLFAVCFRGSA